MNIWLYILSPLILLLIFVVGYLFFAFVFKHLPANAREVQPEEGIDIGVVSNGVHTDIIVPMRTPQRDWSKFIDLSHYKTPDAQYVSFGWGDKGFYLDTPSWAELKFKTAFKALFYLGSTAVMVSLYKEMPEDEKYFSKITISPYAYRKLILYIKHAFDYDAHDHIIPIDFAGMPAYEHLDYKFYEGRGRYHFFKTCNIWVNNGLKVADIKTGIWTPFATAVFHHLPKDEDETV
jgi:uncharacterized protein (TIGR02117 family)